MDGPEDAATDGQSGESSMADPAGAMAGAIAACVVCLFMRMAVSLVYEFHGTNKRFPPLFSDRRLDRRHGLSRIEIEWLAAKATPRHRAAAWRRPPAASAPPPPRAAPPGCIPETANA